jgi:hypothetical protein
MTEKEQKFCKDCGNFLGGGDWNLCCSKPPARAKESWCGFLCYEDTEACENYRRKEHIKKFISQVKAGKLPPLGENDGFGIQYINKK